MTSVGSESVAVIPGRDGRASAGVAPGDGVITRSDICAGGALGGEGVPSSGDSPGAANRIQSLRDVVSDLFAVFYLKSSEDLGEQMPSRWINVSEVAGNKGGSLTKEGLVRLLRHLAEGKMQKVEDIISASDLARKDGEKDTCSVVSAFVKPGAWGDVGMEHVHGFDTMRGGFATNETGTAAMMRLHNVGNAHSRLTACVQEVKTWEVPPWHVILLHTTDSDFCVIVCEVYHSECEVFRSQTQDLEMTLTYREPAPSTNASPAKPLFKAPASPSVAVAASRAATRLESGPASKSKDVSGNDEVADRPTISYDDDREKFGQGGEGAETESEREDEEGGEEEDGEDRVYTSHSPIASQAMPSQHSARSQSVVLVDLAAEMLGEENLAGAALRQRNSGTEQRPEQKKRMSKLSRTVSRVPGWEFPAVDSAAGQVLGATAFQGGGDAISGRGSCMLQCGEEHGDGGRLWEAEAHSLAGIQSTITDEGQGDAGLKCGSDNAPSPAMPTLAGAGAGKGSAVEMLIREREAARHPEGMDVDLMSQDLASDPKGGKHQMLVGGNAREGCAILGCTRETAASSAAGDQTPGEANDAAKGGSAAKDIEPEKETTSLQNIIEKYSGRENGTAGSDGGDLVPEEDASLTTATRTEVAECKQMASVGEAAASADDGNDDFGSNRSDEGGAAASFVPSSVPIIMTPSSAPLLDVSGHPIASPQDCASTFHQVANSNNNSSSSNSSSNNNNNNNNDNNNGKPRCSTPPPHAEAGSKLFVSPSSPHANDADDREKAAVEEDEVVLVEDGEMEGTVEVQMSLDSRMLLAAQECTQPESQQQVDADDVGVIPASPESGPVSPSAYGAFAVRCESIGSGALHARGAAAGGSGGFKKESAAAELERVSQTAWENDAAQRDAAEKCKRDAAEKCKRDAAEKDKRDAAEKDKRDAVEKDKRDAAEKDKRDAAEKDKRDAVEKDKRDAAEKDKRDAAEKDKRDAVEKDKRDAAEKDKRDAVEKDKRDAVEKDKRDAVEKWRRDAAAKERQGCASTNEDIPSSTASASRGILPNSLSGDRASASTVGDKDIYISKDVIGHGASQGSRKGGGATGSSQIIFESQPLDQTQVYVPSEASQGSRMGAACSSQLDQTQVYVPPDASQGGPQSQGGILNSNSQQAAVTLQGLGDAAGDETQVDMSATTAGGLTLSQSAPCSPIKGCKFDSIESEGEEERGHGGEEEDKAKGFETGGGIDGDDQIVIDDDDDDDEEEEEEEDDDDYAEEGLKRSRKERERMRKRQKGDLDDNDDDEEEETEAGGSSKKVRTEEKKNNRREGEGGSSNNKVKKADKKEMSRGYCVLCTKVKAVSWHETVRGEQICKSCLDFNRNNKLIVGPIETEGGVGDGREGGTTSGHAQHGGSGGFRKGEREGDVLGDSAASQSQVWGGSGEIPRQVRFPITGLCDSCGARSSEAWYYGEDGEQTCLGCHQHKQGRARGGEISSPSGGKKRPYQTPRGGGGGGGLKKGGTPLKKHTKTFDEEMDYGDEVEMSQAVGGTPSYASPAPTSSSHVAAETKSISPGNDFFKGRKFFLTGLKRANADEGSMTTSECAAIIAKFQGKVVPDPTNMAVGNEGRTIVIADIKPGSTCMTLKYLASLGMGVCAVGIDWLKACEKEGRWIELDSYRLPAGYDEETMDTFFLDDDRRDAPLAMDQRVLSGKIVSVSGPEREIKDIKTLLCFAGATVNEKDICRSHYHITLDEFPQKIIARAGRVPVVTNDWFVRSLWEQKPSEVEPYLKVCPPALADGDKVQLRSSSGQALVVSGTKPFRFSLSASGEPSVLTVVQPKSEPNSKRFALKTRNGMYIEAVNDQEGTLLARAIDKPRAWHHFVIEEVEGGGDADSVSVSLFTAHRTHVAVEGQGAQKILQHTNCIPGDDKRAAFHLVHAD